jgi:hypothetical protein
MAKSIRERAVEVFNTKLVARNNNEYTNDTAFRKDVVWTLVEEFDITVGAASSAYNYAKLQMTASNPDAVKGLGRPEGKNNGGPKKRDTVQAATVQQAANAQVLTIVDARGNVLSSFTAASSDDERRIVLA